MTCITPCNDFGCLWNIFFFSSGFWNIYNKRFEIGIIVFVEYVSIEVCQTS